MRRKVGGEAERKMHGLYKICNFLYAETVECMSSAKKWHFCYRTLLRLAVFCLAFGHLYESC